MAAEDRRTRAWEVEVEAVEDHLRSQAWAEGAAEGHRRNRASAVAVEAAMAEVVAACKASIEQVFDASGPEVAPGAGDAQTAEQAEYKPYGGQAVHWEALSAAGKKVEAPVLKAFERLSLLQ